MSRSVNIIKHLVDENLIDAKTETESYLNDILSNSIKNKYQEVAPSMFTNLDKNGEEEEL